MFESDYGEDMTRPTVPCDWLNHFLTLALTNHKPKLNQPHQQKQWLQANQRVGWIMLSRIHILRRGG